MIDYRLNGLRTHLDRWMDHLKMLIIACATLIAFAASDVHAQNAQMDWQAGVASAIITPEQPMWMAGFGFRDRPAEGTRDELWAKALVLEDERGHRGVLITTDLLGFPRTMSDAIRDALYDQYDLGRDQIILNSSHTHSGPVLEHALVDIYPINDAEEEQIDSYSRWLEDRIVDLVGEAMEEKISARVSAGQGVARFAVNRRNNDAQSLHRQTELVGPSDHDVPVLRVESVSGDPFAIVFGYACHTTTLADYEWSGDFAGEAQLAVEATYPEATALFFQGAGADQNPLPRGSGALATQYGETLAAAVKRVLEEDMRALPAELSTAYHTVDLDLAETPSRAEYEEMAEEFSGYSERWAHRMIEKLDRGEELPTSYPFPIQAWHVGDQPVIALGGELVVTYAVETKRMLGDQTFVMGYSNDVMGYIPSTRILREGGYEGDSAQRVYGLPGPWAASIQPTIMQGVLDAARQAGIPIP